MEGECSLKILQNSGVPIYQQIAEQLKEDIMSGKLKQGEYLPSIRGLAKDLKISVITTMKAYEQLAEEGLVTAAQGKGFYVNAQDSEMLKEQHLRKVESALLEAIAAAKGIDIRKADDSSSHGSAVPPSARYSTLQDLDAGRHTEIDMFSGTLMRMGRELGIPTPYNEYTYHMIKALEEKNDGLFNYTATDAVTCSR